MARATWQDRRGIHGVGTGLREGRHEIHGEGGMGSATEGDAGSRRQATVPATEAVPDLPRRRHPDHRRRIMGTGSDGPQTGGLEEAGWVGKEEPRKDKVGGERDDRWV
jgi:hypothetical protein